MAFKLKDFSCINITHGFFITKQERFNVNTRNLFPISLKIYESKCLPVPNQVKREPNCIVTGKVIRPYALVSEKIWEAFNFIAFTLGLPSSISAGT